MVRKRGDERAGILHPSVPRRALGVAKGAMDHLRDLVPRGFPHPEVHASGSGEGRVQSRHVVSGDDDGHASTSRAVVRAPLRADAHARRVVAQVHQRRLDDLVVDGDLIVLESSDASVEVVDDEDGGFAGASGRVGGGEVSAAEERAGLARDGVLELARGDDDGGYAEVAAAELEVEGFTAALAAPDAEDEGHAAGDAAGVREEVLGDVDRETIAEALGDVVVADDVAEGAKVADAEVAGRDVGVHAEETALEELLGDAAALGVDEILPAESVAAAVRPRRPGASRRDRRAAATGAPGEEEARRARERGRGSGEHVRARARRPMWWDTRSHHRGRSDVAPERLIRKW